MNSGESALTVTTAPTDVAASAATPSTASVTSTEASDSVARTLYLAIGISGVMFGALVYGAMRLQSYPPMPWLSPALWTLLVGLLASLGILARWAPHRVLRIIAVTAGLVQLATILLWLIIGEGRLPADAGIPWATTFTGVPAVAIAAAVNSRVAWAYAILVCSLGALLRADTTSYHHPILIGLQDGLYSFLLVGVFVGLVLATKESAVRRDETMRAARRESAERAGRLARRRERLLINALVHDSVLSTLLMAGLGRTSADAVALHARRTTNLLNSLAVRESSTPITAGEFETRLRETAVKLQPGIDIVVREGEPAPSIPREAAEALVDAVAEAVRNSALHAGRGRGGAVSRSITLERGAAGVSVIVADDGVGFNAAEVPAQRLGIAQSMVGRMQRVAGGSATVWSAPGHGTKITLSWSPPDLAQDSRAPIAGYSFAGIRLVTRRAVRGALLLFVAAHALLAFGDRDPRGPLVFEIAAVLAVSAAAVLVTSPAPYPLPRQTTVQALVLCAVTATLQLFQVTPDSALPFAQWHLGAITLILLVLVAQRRIGWAWIGYAVLLGAMIGWAVANGLTPGDGVDMVIRHAGTLVAGSLFVLGLRRSAATLETINSERTQRAIEEATTAASLRERASELAKVNSRARSLLDRLAGLRVGEARPGESEPGAHAQAPCDDLKPVRTALRAECLLVEASLRDSIRGRSLSIEPVITAAHRARARGVDVTLIDDGDDGSDARNIGVVATSVAIANELERMQGGRLTARILPSGRPEFATIVVESAEQRMLTVDAAGTVREL
ncbi:ATP-binding protein [Leifsonia sp. YAF41]|uniref:sensor histidine kinase n=1 Tax=Leifsonia sp. YAF41 TaxID=3233086 RepID=UPI003F9733F6